ncbi:prolyl oligopeptidase family serine peptidase [Alkalitalea saponilacus]|uniref:prolyl oligopeptidase n=1 Tax=Alkalitalea saponilacus TaxID=889453 RepID=A0A1T5EQE3_9BACT|nr:prolyl oligopeptidase family serine peptidase [Alkalitalea saponilacus]ASB48059.1 S9 family peptidase [Alkalitalea saponilacus]SKB86088.1 prolyl oligopeptidase [Alkalitalea saponilacus]
MKRKLVICVTLLALTIAGTSCRQKSSPGLTYPVTQKGDVVDTYFGHEVPDPFRWLEDDHAPETKEWVKAQNKVTNAWLQQIPFREDIKNRLTEVWSYTRQFSPWKRGENIFYYRHDGIRNHAVLYVKEKNGEEKVLIDPNLFSEDGTTSLAMASVSKDGKYVAYGISKGGSDWREVFVREVATGKDLDTHLKWIKFSGLSWDENGFYYSRYDEPAPGDELSASNEFQKVFYHKLGTSQDQDLLIHQDNDNPQMNFSAQVDDDNKYLMLYSRISTQGNNLFIRDLNRGGNWIVADTDFETQSSYVGTIGNEILVLTNYDAPRYRLMAIHPNRPNVENWREIIPESGNVLRSVTTSDNYIIAHYMVDVQSRLSLYSKAGRYIRDIKLPGSGSASGLSTFSEEDVLYFTFASFTTPESVYRKDLKSTNPPVAHFVPNVDFKSEEYTVNQVFVEAEDGAEIPLFIVHKKDIELDGSNPALLYGYGGFNVVQSPRFDARIVPWLENGGIYIHAHIRGGGEYGEGWYRAGIKKNKQRVFDDFILAAEFLVESGYTSPEKLAIMGGSNGGLLVGAVANQRPDLFAVALPAVGVMDMLRYQYFTIGWAWAGDYGRSDDSEEMFKYLYAYSPIHNIPKGKLFPATLVTTADHDDRVVPAHSFKYIATLQDRYSGPNPVLIRIETLAGHGAGKPLSMQIEEVADRLAFTLFSMNETWNSEKNK